MGAQCALSYVQVEVPVLSHVGSNILAQVVSEACITAPPGLCAGCGVSNRNRQSGVKNATKVPKAQLKLQSLLISCTAASSDAPMGGVRCASAALPRLRRCRYLAHRATGCLLLSPSPISKASTPPCGVTWSRMAARNTAAPPSDADTMPPSPVTLQGHAASVRLRKRIISSHRLEPGCMPRS